MSSQCVLLHCFGKEVWFNKINYKNWAWNFEQRASEEPACTQHIRLFYQAMKKDEGKFLKPCSLFFISIFYLFWQKKNLVYDTITPLNDLILFATGGCICSTWASVG